MVGHELCASSLESFGPSSLHLTIQHDVYSYGDDNLYGIYFLSTLIEISIYTKIQGERKRRRGRGQGGGEGEVADATER